MSVDISSKLMLVPEGDQLYKKLKEISDKEGVHIHNIISYFRLDYCSVCYDDHITNWVIGFELAEPSYEDLIDSESTWFKLLHSAQTRLCEIVGVELLDTKLQSVQHVY